ARLERIANRCRGQLLDGEPTFISWTGKSITLPTVRQSAASGGVVMTSGLTAALRGMRHKKPNGESVRPDLIVVDDPQSDESARSAAQCAYRERILSGAILGLSGPGEKISAVMPCTTIAPNDLADSFLDPARHPEWRGERLKLIYALPANTGLWAR